MPDTPRYPWYSVVRDASLEQGDILRGLEIPAVTGLAAPDAEDYEGNLLTLDVIILTQSCDIEHGKVKSLVLCPVVALGDFVRAAAERHGQHWNSSKHLEALRQGNLPGYHLISDFLSDELTLDVSVVDFHELYAVATEYAREFVSGAAPRLRLCPPYKEHLAQAFARFFMRIGLPVDISKDKVKAAAGR